MCAGMDFYFKFLYFYWIIWSRFLCVAEEMLWDNFVLGVRNTHGSRVEIGLSLK